MKAIYELSDLYAIAHKEKTVKEMAEKYNTTEMNIYRALNRHHIKIGKRAIRIITPYGSKVAYGMPECADELKVSITSIRNALMGKEVKLFKEMNIRLVYVEDEL